MKNENKNAWSKGIGSSTIADIFFTLAAIATVALLVFELEGLESKIEKSENIKINKNTYTCDLTKVETK